MSLVLHQQPRIPSPSITKTEPDADSLGVNFQNRSDAPALFQLASQAAKIAHLCEDRKPVDGPTPSSSDDSPSAQDEYPLESNTHIDSLEPVYAPRAKRILHSAFRQFTDTSPVPGQQFDLDVGSASPSPAPVSSSSPYEYHFKDGDISETTAYDTSPSPIPRSSRTTSNRPHHPSQKHLLLMHPISDSLNSTPSPSPTLPSHSSYHRTDEGKVCTNCGAVSTPLWRKDPITLKLLCNACGLYTRAKHKARPLGETILPPRDAETTGSSPQCSNCHATSTPLWRKDRLTNKLLCNACGLHSRMKGKPRPRKVTAAENYGKPPGETTRCTHCGSTQTPLWRKHPITSLVLCNACGLYLRLRNKPRPLKFAGGGRGTDSGDDPTSDTESPALSS